jgi:hypothetical protein
MKKVFFSFAVLMLLSAYSYAQGFRLGVKAGANMTKLSGQSFEDEFDLGYQLGAFSEIDFSKKLGIQPEVLFSQVNTKKASGFNSIYNNLGDPNSTSDIQLKYLQIPVLLRYNVGKMVTLNLGPQFSILVDDNENLFKNGENAFKSGDFSMVGGATVNLSRFRIYGRYNVGLNNLNDIDNKDEWKSQQLQLGLGIKF